jgi:hypothetical protein
LVEKGRKIVAGEVEDEERVKSRERRQKIIEPLKRVE